MIDLNLHGASQKEKKHFLDRITGLTGFFKRLIFDILFIQSILSKGFYVSYVYPSFCCFRQEREKRSLYNAIDEKRIS
jgi:hypothetical protein